MTMDVRKPELRRFALDALFGLEREALRVTRDGRMAHTPHPFPAGHKRIVRDFCENQTEINTGVHPSPAQAVRELEELNGEILRAIAGRGELLWPFSNPPPLRGEDDVVPAAFGGELSGKSSYRDYLGAKYGRYLMTFCGIHVNFSFGRNLLEAAFGAGDSFATARDALYLHVAEESVLWGWIAVVLTAASPVLDASFLSSRRDGRAEDVFPGFASVRCGDIGYWNHFAAVNDFSSVEAYAEAIRGYVKSGLIVAPSELYFPVRLKPRGPNRLESLVEGGIDHIELRCVDLNPFNGGLVDARDVAFVQLFLLWCAARPHARLSGRDHVQATRNFKNAARYDIDLARIVFPDGSSATVREAARRILDSMEAFFEGFPEDVSETLAFEREKLERPSRRYSVQVEERFAGTFAGKGLEYAKKLTEDAGV